MPHPGKRMDHERGVQLDNGCMLGACCFNDVRLSVSGSVHELSELELLRKHNAELLVQNESLREEVRKLLHLQELATQQMQPNDVSKISGGPSVGQPDSIPLCALSPILENEVRESTSANTNPGTYVNGEKDPASRETGVNMQVTVANLTDATQEDGSQEKGCLGQDLDAIAVAANDLVDERKHKTLLKNLRDSHVFNIVSFVALAFALVGSSVWTICDVPDDPGNAVLDAVMVSITLFFVFEIVVNAIVSELYRLSFFFWMDVLGTLSMLFEISFLLGSSGANVGTNKLRAARASKLGARAGRLLKLVKCLTLYYRRTAANDDFPEAVGLSKRLMQAVSTKVSMLTVFLFMVLPLFSLPLYPEDLSMSLWSQRLEESYYLAYSTNSLDSWQLSVRELDSFYRDVNYHPYMIEGFSEILLVNNTKVIIPGQSLLSHSIPARKQNVFQYDVKDCRLIRDWCNAAQVPSIYFDFTQWNQVEAGLDIATTVFVIIVMIVASFDINNSITAIWFKPITRMLHIARVRAASICQNFFDFHGIVPEDDGDEQPEDAGTELDMLEHILDKLARMADLVAQRNELDGNELASMDREGLGVMFDLLGSKLRDNPDASKLTVVPKKDDIASFEAAQKIQAWDVNVLEMQAGEMLQLIYTIFFETSVSPARNVLEQETFYSFHRLVKLQYYENPYHCYPHACDVLHTVFRELSLTKSTEWMNENERYALLVAALCHDLGHFGKTNPFLVETKHEIAILYNDASPLENMHCAKLFEICSHVKTDVFSKLSHEDQKEVRKVCIASILHTDNSHHFTMVKDIAHAFELASDICEAQAVSAELLPKYKVEVLQKDKSIWLQLFLHLADVSNPLKPFNICYDWAWRVLDEFFAQGDEEKQLGIPVGMLNDRVKVNRPGSQHGFINFLVAPLVLNAVRLFPVLQPLYAQMASNLEDWRDMWIRDAQPSAEDIAKKDADVWKIKETSQELMARRSDTSRQARTTVGRATRTNGRNTTMSIRQSLPALRVT